MKNYRIDAIRARLVALGVDPEKFDIRAHVDTSLTQRENMMNLRGLAHVSSGPNYHGQEPRKPKHPNEFWQQGRSNLELDKLRHAELPGKRIVRYPGLPSTVYYEHRRNRSDRPGRRI
jgi:hypothetical protein